MAPLLKKEEYSKRSLFDIDPSSMHIHDLIHQEGCYNHRTSDLITGMLLLAVHEKVITKVEACWFAVPFTIGAKLRTSVYKHEGNPFLGPDGYPMLIAGTPFGGRDYVAQSSGDGESDGPARPDRLSAYNFKTMRQAENFDEWLAKTLFRGTHRGDSDFARNHAQPPKRRVNGARADAPDPTALTPSSPPAPASPSPSSGSPLPSAAPSPSPSKKRAHKGEEVAEGGSSRTRRARKRAARKGEQGEAGTSVREASGMEGVEVGPEAEEQAELEQELEEALVKELGGGPTNKAEVMQPEQSSKLNAKSPL